MKNYLSIIFLVLGVGTALTALGEDTEYSGYSESDDEIVWDGIVANVCIEQDARYKKTWYGKEVIKDESYTEWKSQLSATSLACVKSKKFIPKKLCDELFSVDKNSGDLFLEGIYKRNKSVIDNLSELNSCMDKPTDKSKE